MTTHDLLFQIAHLKAVEIDGQYHAPDGDRWTTALPTSALLAAGEAPILVTSSDGWSIHHSGASDEEIAEGDAPPLADGPWMPTWWSPERRWKYDVRLGRLVTADLTTGEEVPE